MNKLRIVIADDERPGRSFLKAILREFEQVELVGEAVLLNSIQDSIFEIPGLSF